MKKILLILLLCACPWLVQAQQKQIYCISSSQTPCSSTQQIGNGGQGDPGWLFNGKSNYNFGQLYGMWPSGVGLLVGNGAPPIPMTILAPGATGQYCLQWSNINAAPTLVTCSSGGGANPGGSQNQLQYYLTSTTLGGIGYGTTGQPLLSAGSAAPPAFGQLDLTIGVTNVLPVANGGTGANALTQYDLLAGNGTSPLGLIPPSSTGGYPLLSSGSFAFPAYGQLDLTIGVTNTLPIANGGTGATTAAGAAQNILPTYVASDCLSTNGTALLWTACGGGGTSFQANGVALSSTSPVNFQSGSTVDGITPTLTNPSAGNVQVGLSVNLATFQAALIAANAQQVDPFPGAGPINDWDPSQLAAPTQNAPSTSTTGGSLPATTAYFFKIVAVNARGTTTPSGEQTITTGAGSTNSITVNWAAVTDATGYQVWFSTTTGGENQYFTASGGSTVTYSFTTTSGATAGTIPSSNTTGGGIGSAGLVVSLPSAASTINGMVAGSNMQELILLNNSSSNSITLVAQSSSDGTAANRFIEPGTGLTIAPQTRAICFYYANTVNRWNCQ